MAFLKPPHNKSRWLAKATQNGVEDKSIHGLANLEAGSKIGEIQYLVLRSVWVSKQRDFNPSKAGIQGLDDARKWLNNRLDWQNYLEDLGPSNSVIPVGELGSFSFVCFSRRQISGVRKVDDVGKVQFTPWANRLRPPREANRKAKEPYPDESPSVYALDRRNERRKAASRDTAATILPAVESLSLDDVVDDDDEDDDNEEEEEEDEEEEGDMSKESPAYSTTPRTARKFFPDVEDEQIVNTFLVALLSCLTFHNDDIRSAWSPLRKAFKFGKNNKKHLFEARTDGHLFLSASVAAKAKSSVILEVKPTHRSSTNKVIYQATAQMAAWIFSEPDEGKQNMYRRPMIIQERDEIRLVIAEYDSEYLSYIRNTSKQ